jgi:hypothetical protein
MMNHQLRQNVDIENGARLFNGLIQLRINLTAPDAEEAARRFKRIEDGLDLAASRISGQISLGNPTFEVSSTEDFWEVPA